MMFKLDRMPEGSTWIREMTVSRSSLAKTIENATVVRVDVFGFDGIVRSGDTFVLQRGTSTGFSVHLDYMLRLDTVISSLSRARVIPDSKA